MERFPPTTTDLEAFAERIEALTQALVDGRDVEPLVDESRCVAQDLAWRILTVWTETDSEVAAGLLDRRRQAQGHAPSTIRAVRRAAQRVDFTEPQRLFACGYPLELGSV